MPFLKTTGYCVMRTRIWTLIIGFALTFAAAPVMAQDEIAAAQAIAGFWLTEDKEAVVELYPCDGKVCGRFRWLKDDSLENPSLDDKNPDPAEKKRPLCGMQFMGGFTPMGHGYFTDGWIYSPRHGSTFNAKLILKEPDKLELYGYFLVTLFGESQMWQRLETAPVCPLLEAASVKENLHAGHEK